MDKKTTKKKKKAKKKRGRPPVTAKRKIGSRSTWRGFELPKPFYFAKEAA